MAASAVSPPGQQQHGRADGDVQVEDVIDAAADHPESATWALEWLGSLRGMVGYLAEVSGS